MADKKISQLTGATTPLAGTEVLPIVQGGSTVKVAVSNLTAGRSVAGASFQANNRIVYAGTALYDVPGPTGNNTGLAFSGNLWLPCDGTGALTNGVCSIGSASYRFNELHLAGNVVPAATKGIDFSANTHAAGMTSELLNWYEEGTWTPTLTINTPGDLAITYSSQVGYYTRIGRLVSISFDLQTSAFTHSTATGVWRLAGLPFLATSNIAYRGGTLAGFQGITKANYTQFGLQTATGVAQLLFVAGGSGQAWDYLNPADLPSGGSLILQGFAQFIL